MTSQNLELFPDDLFARKGDAAPAGNGRKDKAETAALVATETAPPPVPDEAPAEGREDGAPEAEAKALDETVAGDAEETGAAGVETAGKTKRGKSRGAAEAAPAASVLKFRLLDEVTDDLDDILRCAESRPTPAADETTAAEAPETDASETEGPETGTADLGPAAPVAEGTPLWKPRTWPTWARAVAVLLLLAGGALAGWYAATPDSTLDPEGSAVPEAAGRDAPTAGSETPSDTRNALERLGAKGGATGGSAPAAEAGETPAEAEGPAPKVDVVRVEEDGSAVIAGMAPPGSELIVLHNGAPIGVAQADAFGQWVLLPEAPLAEGPHEFGLVLKAVEGSVILPGSAAPQSEAPTADDAAPGEEDLGGEADDQPALDQESRLPAPEPASKPLQALATLPLPPRKPTADATALSQDDKFEPSYVVQLASAPSADGAASEWQRLRKAHPELLARQDLAVQRADLADRGAVFRVRTGSFETLLAARRFCAAFRRQKQDCLVVKLTEPGETGPTAATRLTRNHSW